ncbi:hypothetical protein [Vibrio sp. 99-8-1]|uniref:hypothetical protein n=1 Tax=Vibrio sp. 99-8-1 TaxID=2607602 RepID=UPI001493ABC0|nr:hypothetical protein [Vibrio sp. 99-8-1]NOI67780.1 hypothetical protein [Vibrio sp. 99-8-1]
MQRSRLYLSNQACLNVSALYKYGLLKVGCEGTSSITKGDTTVWSLDWAVSDDLISVTYLLKGQGRRHRIKLIHQPVNFGGSRIYLMCPYCGKNRKQIYFIAGYAACRCCHGLHYRCQSESPLDRSIRTSNRLYKQFMTLSEQCGYYEGKALRRAKAACLAGVKANSSQFRKLVNSRFSCWK